MAKNKNDNNSLFSGYKPPVINSSSAEKDKPKSSTAELSVDNKTSKSSKSKSSSAAKESAVAQKKQPAKKSEPVEISVPSETPELISPAVATVPESETRNRVIPLVGRPKQLDGIYHRFQARIREDLYSYALSISGPDQQYQSINAYLNELIANDMEKKL